MDAFALALTGGGAKGAFQAGVLRYFEQQRLFPHIPAVTGVSIGTINAVLFALKDYKRAFSLWNGSDMRTLLTPNVGFTVELIDGKPCGVFRKEKVKDVLRKLPLFELHKHALRIYVGFDAPGSPRDGALCINDMPRTEDMLEALSCAAAVPFPYPAARLGEAVSQETAAKREAESQEKSEGKPAGEQEETAQDSAETTAENTEAAPQAPTEQMEWIDVPEADMPQLPPDAPLPKQRDTAPAPMERVSEDPLVPLFALGHRRFLIITMDHSFRLDRRRFPNCTAQLIFPGEWMVRAELGAPNNLLAGNTPKTDSPASANYNQAAVMRLMNDGYNCAHRALTTKQFGTL